MPTRRNWHSGVDYHTPDGAEQVFAIRDGTIAAINDAGYESYAIIDVGGGIRDAYGHVDLTDLDEGEAVFAGDLLGTVNTTYFNHLHYGRYDTNNQAIQNPFAVNAIQDIGTTGNPTVEEIYFRNDDANSSGCPGGVSGNVVWGCIDIVAHAYDVTGVADSNSSVHQIGYSVDNVSSGFGSVQSLWLLTDATALDGAPPPGNSTDYFYNTTSECVSEQHHYCYVVTNNTQQSGALGGLGRAGAWNTNATGGNTGHATSNSNAQFKDGTVRVKVRAADDAGTWGSDASEDVIIDNFVPIAKRLVVTDTFSIDDPNPDYRAEWAPNLIVRNNDHLLSAGPGNNWQKQVYVEFSEPVQHTPYIVVEGTSIGSFMQTFDQITWWATLNFSSLYNVSPGNYYFSIQDVEDLAGNELDSHPETTAVRDSGGWLYEGGDDRNHYFNVPPSKPIPPENVSVTLTESGAVLVSWDFPPPAGQSGTVRNVDGRETNDLDKYNVYRRVQGGEFELIGSRYYTRNYFLDDEVLQENSVYEYTVTNVDLENPPQESEYATVSADSRVTYRPGTLPSETVAIQPGIFTIMGISWDFRLFPNDPERNDMYEGVDTIFDGRDIYRVENGKYSTGIETWFNGQCQMDIPYPGTAFWVHNPPEWNDPDINIHGQPTSSTSSAYSIPLDEGWSMISNPFTNIDLNWNGANVKIQNPNTGGGTDFLSNVNAPASGWVSGPYKYSTTSDTVTATSDTNLQGILSATNVAFFGLTVQTAGLKIRYIPCEPPVMDCAPDIEWAEMNQPEHILFYPGAARYSSGQTSYGLRNIQIWNTTLNAYDSLWGAIQNRAWINSEIKRYYTGYALLEESSPMKKWEGYVLKARYPGMRIIFDTGESGKTPAQIAFDRYCAPDEEEQQQQSAPRPLARIASSNTMGGNEIKKGVGEIFDLDLTIDADGFTDASFVVEYDGTVIAPCVKDAQYPNDASKCMVLATDETVPVSPASGLQVWTATVGNSIKFDLFSFGEPFVGQVYLGTISFKVLSTASGMTTDITFNTDEDNLMVMGKIEGKLVDDYEITVSPARFVESNFVDYSPPTITVTETTPAPPQTWIRPGAAAPTPSSVTVKYRFTDNYYTTGNVKAAVYNSSGTMVTGTLSEAADVSVNVEQTFTWYGKNSLADEGSAVADSLYNVKIEVTDAKGNKATVSVPVTVDKSGPVISYPLPAANKDTGTLTPEIRVRIEDGANGVGVMPVVCGAGQTPGEGCGLKMEADGTTVAAIWNSGTKLLTAPSSLALSPVNNHTVKITAGDKLGNTSEYEWSFTVDSTAPGAPTVVFSTEQILSAFETMMGISVPRDGKQYVSGNAMMTATAKDNTKGVGIQRIELSVNGELIGTQSYSTPLSEATGFFFWNTLTEQPAGTRKYPDGQYALDAVAFDLIGNRSATVSAVVFVDNTKPVISNVAVSNGGYFSTTGNSAIKTVEITPIINEKSSYGWRAEIGTGDKTLGTWSEVYSSAKSATPPAAAGVVAWDGKNNGGAFAPDGEYKYYITALDGAAQAVSYWEAASGTIVIDSATPTVTLISPADGDILSGDILFEADASDGKNGTGIKKVEISRNLIDVEDELTVQNMKRSRGTAQYEYTWRTDDPDDGIFEITTTSYDLAGNHYTTTPIELSVANRPAAIVNVKDTPDPFSPSPPGNSPKTTNSISFKIVTSVPTVGVDWSVGIGPETDWTPFKSFIGNIPSDPGRTTGRHDIGPLVWDGRNTGGTETAADGLYKYVIDVTTTTGATASVEGGKILVDHTPPVVQNVTATPDFFNPDGNGQTDATTISARIIEVNKFKARFEIFGNGYTHTVEKDYIPGAGGATEISMPWDGKAKNAGGALELVPDGDYTFRITAEDIAGNTSNISEGIVTKDNPPVITLKKATVAFSPDADGSIDTAKVEWAADQEGLFTLKVYDAGMQLIDTIATDLSNAGSVGATMTITWDGLRPDGSHFDEGTYWIEITGRDANSRKENPCVPKKAKTILDVTDPTLEAFYPREDEFTPPHPKLKVNVTDNLSGFGDGPEWAEEHTDFFIDTDAQGIPASADMRGNLSYRAWAYPAGDLAEGPHRLKATAMDIAGNTGTMNWTRFVAIPALEDNFTGESISTEKWLEMLMGASAGTTGSASLQGGKLVINSSTTIPDKESTPGIDTYGYGITGKLVVDITRPEVIVEATDVTIDGSGSMYLGGILLTYANLGAPGDATVGGVGLALAYSDDYPEGHTYAMVLRSVGADTIPVWWGEVTTPADLKIHYEEGNAAFYINGQPVKTLPIQLSHAVTGAYAGSGFDEDDYTNATVHLAMGGFSSNLAAPVVKKITLTNADRPDVRTIHPGEEHYELTVEGTPWQKHVEGRIFNFEGMKDFGMSGIEGATIGESSILAETAEGAGIYKTPAPALFATTIDKTGKPTNKPVPFASNETYGALPFVTVNGIIGDPLLAVTEAVTSARLENADYPPGYSHILPGEHYRVVAETRPGDWEIEAYILSWDALAGGASYPDAVLAGPLTMVKTADGRYEISGSLDNIEWNGAPSTRILAWIKYGVVKDETNLSANMLEIGQPAILYAAINNNDRYGAADVNIGETIEVTAKALPNQPYLVGMLLNADNLDAPELKSRVGIPFAMTETQPGSGEYMALVVLKNDFELTGASVSRLKALTMTGDFTTFALSWNELTVPPQEKVAPAKPEDAVIVSGIQQPPGAGTQVTTSITWTRPAANEDGT